MPIQIPSVVFDNHDGYPEVSLDQSFLTTLVLQLHVKRIDSAPSAITVSVHDGNSVDDFVFRIDGREVFRLEPDPDGGLDLASIPVPNLKDAGGNPIMDPGMHEISVVQNQSIGTATFKVVNPPDGVPEIIEPDAPPVAVPGAVQPNGVRRWVFQDLMPGGLGSWVLPMNPEEMGSPAFNRELTAKSTTASEELGGQFHIYEDAFTPVEWQFSGFCPSEEMRTMLEAFADLNRRWYLHDHRGRAWKVVFQDLELITRRTLIWNGDYTDQAHDYQAVVLVVDRDWVEVL